MPKGTLLHVMDGHGVTLTYDRAQFTTLWPLCNWWIDFDYCDAAGSRYKHVQGQAHGGRCMVNGNVRVDFGTGGSADARPSAIEASSAAAASHPRCRFPTEFPLCRRCRGRH
ncbi:hypothetical protein [Streptomyces sp. NPDC058108]|uniref:hypothetical protein n=1 Tax=Streptomyces sp. NPDC058108 TaxID=3346344 RepID=UPI0036E02B85